MIYSFNGHNPDILEEKNSYIAPSADVIGKVTLGEKTSIWFGAVLRGDIEPITIGEGSNVQDLCVVHTGIGAPAVIGKNCTIGHNAMIHGCEIGDNCLIGMGAIILNHAKIGKNSIIGAGAVVTQGKEFPENSLIYGNPARVVRELTAAELKSINDSALSYQEKIRTYKLEMEPFSIR